MLKSLRKTGIIGAGWADNSRKNTVFAPMRNKTTGTLSSTQYEFAMEECF
jgi:hypothetical protein